MSMTTKGNNNKQTNRRRDILAAAERIFGIKGYSEASIDEIAVEAGVAKGSIYNYFKSKNDLFIQLFIEEMEVLRVGIGEVIGQEISAHEKLNGLLDQSFERITINDKGVCGLALEFWVGAIRQGESGQISEVFDELYGWYHNVIVEILQFGQQQGEFVLDHDAGVVATLLMAVMDGLWLQSLVGVVKNIDKEHVETLKQAIFKSLSKEITDS